MPIIGLKCPKCIEDVGPEHFGLDACEAVPRALAEYVMHMQDERPAGWSVTELLGSVREVAIMKYLPVRVNPMDYLSIFTGQAAHKLLAKYDPPVGRMYGEIGGLRVSGEWDLGSDMTVADYKWTGSLWNTKAARDSHIAQVSMYAILAEQNGRPRPHRGLIHYGGFGKELKTFAFPLWPEPRILGYVIANDGTTVGDNIERVKAIDKMMDSPAGPPLVSTSDVEAAVRALPCTCEHIYYGKACKKDSYCSVSSICRKLDGVPF